MNIFEAIGWLGAIFFILAYLLLSLDKLKSDGVTYQLMNVIGGFCLVINSINLNDHPNLVTNFIWMCIGLFAIFKIASKKVK